MFTGRSIKLKLEMIPYVLPRVFVVLRYDKDSNNKIMFF